MKAEDPATRATLLLACDVSSVDLHVDHELSGSRIVYSMDGQPVYIRQGAAEREISRRVGDLVAAGVSVADARRMAPTTPTPPEERLKDMWGSMMTPTELAEAKQREFYDSVARFGLTDAAQMMAHNARYRANCVASAVAGGRGPSDPMSCREWAEDCQLREDSFKYRRLERERRLVEGGAHRLRDADLFSSCVLTGLSTRM